MTNMADSPSSIPDKMQHSASEMPRTPAPTTPPPSFPADTIWMDLGECAAAQPPFTSLNYQRMSEILQRLKGEHNERLTLSHAGASAEGRNLWTIRLGAGPRNIIIWARQHGDEPLCTAAALNIINYLCSKSADPVAAAILNGATLLFVPMVNPDGAQRFTRRSAMGIDLNRDAQQAITPEGRAMLRLKDDFAPISAFALHDMGPRKATVTDEQLVALAILVNPFDKQGNTNDVRMRAKRIAARMIEATGAVAYRHIARYDAPFMPRAFGDSMTRWGVPTVLIESGGWFEPDAETFVARLHALALLAGLHAVATGAERAANPAMYDALPLDTGRPYFDIVIRAASFLDGSGRPLAQGDFAINCETHHRREHEERFQPLGILADMGDMSEDTGKTELRAEGLLLTPGLAGIAPGIRVQNPGELENLLPCLRAGFTTIAGGCGPFSGREELAAWKKELADCRAPVNFLAFEVVNTLQEVLERHGQSETYGLLVPNLNVAPPDLLAAIHLFHPAAHSALTQEQEEMRLSVDLLLRAVGDPRANRLHLLVRPADPVRPPEDTQAEVARLLKALFAAFIRHPDQIGITVDTTCAALGIFPNPPNLGGIGGGRSAPADFLARTIATLRCKEEDHLSMIVSRLTYQPAMALGQNGTGAVRQGGHADFALYEVAGPAQGASPGAPLPLAPRVGIPRHVIVNGTLALENGKPVQPYGGLVILR